MTYQFCWCNNDSGQKWLTGYANITVMVDFGRYVMSLRFVVKSFYSLGHQQLDRQLAWDKKMQYHTSKRTGNCSFACGI